MASVARALRGHRRPWRQAGRVLYGVGANTRSGGVFRRGPASPRLTGRCGDSLGDAWPGRAVLLRGRGSTEHQTTEASGRLLAQPPLWPRCLPLCTSQARQYGSDPHTAHQGCNVAPGASERGEGSRCRGATAHGASLPRSTQMRKTVRVSRGVAVVASRVRIVRGAWPV